MRAPKVTSEELKILIADKTKWPICQTPSCGNPIPYNEQSHRRSAAAWRRIKYCSSCFSRERRDRCLSRNKGAKVLKRTCECGVTFKRPKTIASRVWAVMVKCPECKRLERCMTGTVVGKPIKPGFYVFSMLDGAGRPPPKRF